jgi:hypothetical protein
VAWPRGCVATNVMVRLVESRTIGLVADAITKGPHEPKSTQSRLRSTASRSTGGSHNPARAQEVLVYPDADACARYAVAMLRPYCVDQDSPHRSAVVDDPVAEAQQRFDESAGPTLEPQGSLSRLLVADRPTHRANGPRDFSLVACDVRSHALSDQRMIGG